MRSMKLGAVFAVGLMAAACGTTEIAQVRGMTQTGGTEFTQALASGYRALAIQEEGLRDWSDAYMYARKGLAAGQGQTVMPEDPANYALPASMMPEFQSARARLIAALDAGGRQRLPRVAAGAQLAYDCWVEEQEEGWQIDCIEKCKRDFYALLAQLEARPAPAAAPAPAAPPAPRQFIVFFDFDRSNITAEGARVIQQVIASYRQKAGPVSVVGHTDRSGTPQYNQGLSVRRANSVKAALVRGGIAAGQVSTAGRGESEPRVPTPDGVREPQNRRAEIRIQ